MARAFARAGANVVLADISSESVERAADEVRRLGGSAVSVVTDVTSLESSNELADHAYRAFGRVDILFNNAGTSVLRRFADLTHDDWAKVFSVQLGGVINGVLAFLPRMLEQGGGGHVVNTSSMSGVGRGDLRTLNAPYVAAKFAVVGLSETMAPALAGEGIKVSVLCPGFTVADPNAVTNFAIPSAAWYEDNLLTPDQVAEEMLRGIAEERLYIFPHRAGRAEVEARHAALMTGFDQAAQTAPPLMRDRNRLTS